jgi:hypothetical protein
VALLNDGQHPNGGRILKPESVKELMRDRLPEKLVPDLERPIIAAQPEMSNPLTILEGIPKQWALAGCKTPEGMPNGRSGKSVWWAGELNTRAACFARLTHSVLGIGEAASDRDR